MERVSGRLKHLVFPTYELYPFNPGGVGVLLAGAVPLLTRAGFHVTLLCEFADHEIEAARAWASQIDLGAGRLDVVALRDVDGGIASGTNVFEINAARFAHGVSAVHEQHPIDYVEFPEYAGMGVVALRQHRRGAMGSTVFALRLHGSLEFIDVAEEMLPTPERRAMWELEREGLQLAPVVMTPSSALGEHYVEHYELDAERLVLSPPPMEELLVGFDAPARLPDPAHFLFFGKLQEVKGCVQLAEAMRNLLASEPDAGWHVTYIGRDTPCAKHGRPTSECMQQVVPTAMRHAFTFVSAIERMDLAKWVRRAVVGVVPSRFETFCLAAHELRAVGLPLVVPRHPAFADWLNESTGCLTYDGTTNGLVEALRTIRHDAAIVADLERAPRPVYPPYAAAYQSVLGAREAR